MICTKKPRELKPGDLFVFPTGSIQNAHLSLTMVIGGQFVHDGNRMKLLERHPCGALEFLVLPNETSKHEPIDDIPACQGIAS